jgi:hypothetical protein
VSLVTELKRRKVFRVAVMYAATAFVVLLIPTVTQTGLTDLPYPERLRRAHERLDAAVATATDDVRRLHAEAVRDQLQLGLRQAFEKMRQVTEHRADPEVTVPLVERALALDPDNARVVYQSHRALLHAGRVDAAAPLARRYAQIDGGSDADVLVQVRQACAEGRVADADRLVAASMRAFDWLVLKTLGRHEEARPILLDFDTPDRLAALHMSLTYPFLDVSELPLLARTLADQGIVRPPPPALPFPCRREPREETGR